MVARLRKRIATLRKQRGQGDNEIRSHKVAGEIPSMKAEQITILGVGNVLYSDEGFGVRVVEELYNRFTFPENVTIFDGNVMGMNLLGVITETHRLIVVDAVMNRGKPGDIHRLEKEKIPKRLLAKNSLHDVDFIEALTLSGVIGKAPETVILGVEPEDIKTLHVGLTETIQSRVEPMVSLVLAELDTLGVHYEKRSDDHVSCDTFKSCPH
jgi:hydrogenase maturation protease